MVFPTPVGVFPCDYLRARRVVSLPHARGGVSQMRFYFERPVPSSPRPWGCFFIRIALFNRLGVFPTPVGVFPADHRENLFIHGLPHARGGVSVHPAAFRAAIQSSPRPWGCFH